jgi:nicotinate-nucleotide adenylyltransferase
MNRRVGLLGGTFDPIHTGHLDLGEAAQQALSLTAVIALPAHVPPHRPAPIASAFHRFAMTAIAIAGRDGWQASDDELTDPGFSFTATTLRRFHSAGFGPSELFFIIGADAFADIQTWRDYPALLEMANFAVVSRPGHPVFALPARLDAIASRMAAADEFAPTGKTTMIVLIDATTADVSSTAIRQRIAGGLDIADMVPPGVHQHIEQHQLYRSSAADRRGSDRESTPAAGRLHGQG